MVNPQTIMTSLYVLIGWTTISTVAIVLARRDVKMGLKKWLLTRLGRQPIKLRYHGPDKTVQEYILGTKGKGEILEINDKKMLVIKTHEGSTFFLDEEAIRRCDDGVNEISYNYRSTQPLNPEQSIDDAKKIREDLITRIEVAKREAQKSDEGFVGVQLEGLVQYTDPKRLNRLMEFVKLAAKTEALLGVTNMEKYVKWGMFAALGALLVGGLIYWTIDGKVMPNLENIIGLLQAGAAQVQTAGAQVLNIG